MLGNEGGNEGLERSDPKPAIVYFFCKAGDETTEQGNRVMLHLLVQLFEQASSEGNNIQTKAEEQRKMGVFADIVERARGGMRGNSKNDSSLVDPATVQPIFTDLAVALRTKVYVVLDALDECSDYDAGLLDALKGLAKPNSPISVLITSRPNDDISRALNQEPSIEINKEKTDPDIRRYIVGSLKPGRRKKDSKNIDQASEIIAQKAEGMFRCKLPPPGYTAATD